MRSFPSLGKIGALLALIALGILVVGIQDLSLKPPRASLPQQHGEPDYYIENARLTRFDAEGKRLQILNSVEATHYPEKDLTQFDSPLMYHYSEDGQVWRVVAERAENLNKNDIYLEDKVIITPLNPDSAYLPEFFTDRLWVDNQTNFAHTEDPVSFISPSGKTTGKGFQLNLDTGLAEILQKTQGSYLPAPANQGTEL
ncbi:LPS export ABC transporter periplasmic protein LptC [Marinospirillum insulare]|uniref:Lipopolysaccharide export system protein LptC n=1 Tax=Marinospirillum insulare TaxID=217169 RepID=A0ABQ5ZZ71_9GAMM|nr:LPS export ABC transporter periplasmic protein LptC [Marinospirillum insulare]GLR63179.1 hypothetical protein GCM10007878_06140 [Marinospirillum insulare]